MDHFKLNAKDTSDFDIMILSMLSTESTRFYSSGSKYTRVEKTALISEYEPTYKYLNVCTSSTETKLGENCSTCYKCMRTQLTLDLLGKLDLYKNVFDLIKYKNSKDRYIAEILSEVRNSQLDRELYDLMKSKEYKMSQKLIKSM